ncbi:MAG: hypothetical protein ACI915_002052 [Gammaproteobacteria bacterium]
MSLSRTFIVINFLARGALATLISLANINVNADGVGQSGSALSSVRSDAHAPIGVMGDHLHDAGEWMLTYRYKYMDMQGNRRDTDRISADTIVTSIPNRFFGRPMQPPTLRVVPTEMRMEMHMFGGMYAPTDWLTVMLMSSYVEKEMDHVTYRGPVGTTVRGGFTTASSGIGDTRITGLVKLMTADQHNVHMNVGGSIPTGSTKERDRILTPLGTTRIARLPYAMQLGSGTFDLLPGLTYTGNHGRTGWGSQYSGTVRTGHDNGYRWGDRHELTGWLSYQPISAISGSVRLQYETMASIDGIDDRIVAPVQTADPNNYGGDELNILLGLNIAGQSGWLRGKRLALEVGIPVVRDLNGPQLESDVSLTAGLQIPF